MSFLSGVIASSRRRSSPASPWDTAIAALDPILWYQLKETAGPTVADSSGNGLTGNLHDNIQFNQPSLFPGLGPSMNFAVPGFSNGGIFTPDNALLNVRGDFTVLIAFQMLALTGWYQKLFWKPTNNPAGEGTYYLGIDVVSGLLRGRVNIAGSYYDTTSPSGITAGVPYLGALARSGTTLSLYLGPLGGSFAQVGTVSLPSGASLDVGTNELMVSGNPSSDSFNGAVNEPILIGSGLSGATLSALFAIASAPP